MIITEMSTILEIAVRPGRDGQRFDDAISSLREAMIGEHRILAVYSPIETSIRVPGFGHNYRCQDGGCSCDVQPLGVLRYFGVVFWVEGDHSIDLFEDYKLTPHAHLFVCGKTKPRKPGTKPLSLARE